MTDLQTLQDDISFLKGLAIEGRSPSVMGGAMLVAAGSAYGVASLGHWAIVSGAAPVPTPWILPILWTSATVGFLAAVTVIKRRFRDAAPANGSGRASAMAWQGVGWAIFTLAACMAIVAWQTHSDAPLRMFPSIILALYGMAWSVAAAVSKVRWTGLAAVGSFAAAILAALFSGSPASFLLFAAALVALAIVPGLAMIRQGRAAS